MSGRFLLAAALAAMLPLSGCVVADGVAHVVKLTQHSGDSSPPPAASAAPSAEPAAAADNGPAPVAPAPAPRESIRVEPLTPPRS